MAAHPYVERINPGGNFCGHDPANPSWKLAHPIKTGKGGIPPILVELTKRLVKYYDKPQKFLPSLNLANGSNRKQRSERRQACIITLAALLKHVDLATLRVGVPDINAPGEFRNFDFNYIVRTSGLSFSRVTRAVKDLKAAGLLSVTEYRVKQGGEWTSMAAVKCIDKNIFHAFGITHHELKKERDRASKRLKRNLQKQSDHSTRDRATNASGVARTALMLKGKHAKRKKTPSTHNSDNDRLREVQLSIQLMQEHPDWPPDKIKAEVHRLMH